VRIVVVIFLSVFARFADAENRAAMWSFEIVEQTPHDIRSFTQGLVMHEGVLYEGTGGYGDSALLRVDRASGDILQRRALPPSLFGEGITVHQGQIWQLTWREGRGFVYDLGFRPLREFRIDGEGWGLASDGERLIMSDGSDRLTWLSPADGRPLSRVTVRDGLRRLRHLNELEFIDGRLFANVWLTDRIAIIDPDRGEVIGWLDLSELRQHFTPPPGFRPREHVLNGIAWDAERRLLLVTGKCWPVMFALRLQPPTQGPAAAPTTPKGNAASPPLDSAIN
jgi:glutaminyl-peptide cyclotransferase